MDRNLVVEVEPASIDFSGDAKGRNRVIEQR